MVLDKVRLLELKETLALLLHFFVLAVAHNQRQILKELLSLTGLVFNFDTTLDLFFFGWLNDEFEIVGDCILPMLNLNVVWLLETASVLTLGVVQVTDVLWVDDGVLVRLPVRAEHVHKLKLPIFIDWQIDVELCLQREVLLLFCRHVTPNNLNNWIVELEVRRIVFLAQISRDVHFLILLDIENKEMLHKFDLLQPRPQIESALKISHLKDKLYLVELSLN